MNIVIFYNFRYRHVCLIFTLLALTTAFSHESSTYFVPLKDVYASYSSWILSFTIDIEPYDDQLNVLYTEIEQFHSAFHDLADKRRIHAETRSNWTEHDTFVSKIRDEVSRLIAQELQQFMQEYYIMKRLMDDIDLLGSKIDKRNKRSLFPFIGTALSNLFGTLSESDLKNVKNALSRLRQSDTQIVHVVRESLSLLNVTHAGVKENRETINRLIQTSKHFHDEFNILLGEVTNIVIPELEYVHLVTRVHDIFHIVHSSIKLTIRSLDNVQKQLTDALSGTLSLSVCSPTDLVESLQTIARKLPSDMRLPFDLETQEMTAYYKFIHPLVIPDKNKFYILAALPIVHSNSELQLFETVSVPIPQPKLNLSAHYNLESDLIAVTSDKMYYSFVNKNDISTCIHTPFCHMSNPLFATKNYPSCIMSLFLTDPDLITQNCKTVFRQLTNVPIVKHFSENKWISTATTPFDVKIICDEISNIKRLTPGVNFIELPDSCSAESEYFKIPRYEIGNSERKNIVEPKLNIDLNFSIWDNQGELIDKFKEFQKSNNFDYSMLKPLSDLPIQHLHYILDHINNVAKEPKITKNHGHTTNNIILICIFIMISIISIVISVSIVYTFKRRILFNVVRNYAVASQIELADLEDSETATSPKSEASGACAVTNSEENTDLVKEC